MVGFHHRSDNEYIEKEAKTMFALIAILLIAMIAHVLAVRGRRGNPELPKLREWSYAHRGLHDAVQPENSLAAFRAAVERGYGIELDVHLLKDGTLAVLHDSDLKRMTGRDGRIEDLTLAELPECHLSGTQQTIPTLRQVLELVNGRVPLILEIKTADKNAETLTEAVVKLLADYKGLYCLESFDPQVLRYLRRNCPRIVRGQLAEDSVSRDKTYSWFTRFICSYYLENFLTLPDFIAYRFEDRENTSITLCRRLWGLQGVSWTIRSPGDFTTAREEGWIPIFENFDPKNLGLE